MFIVLNVQIKGKNEDGLGRGMLVASPLVVRFSSHFSPFFSQHRNLENETEETARSPFRQLLSGMRRRERGSENRGEKEVPGRCFMIIPSPPLQGVTELLPLLPRRRVRVVALRLRQPHRSGRLLPKPLDHAITYT